MNSRQFAKILNISDATVYLIRNPQKKAEIAKNKAKRENRRLGEKKFIGAEDGIFDHCRTENGRVLIDIDSFVESNKIWNFETLNPPFSNRIFIENHITMEDLPEEMTKVDLMKFYGMTTYSILAMRKSNEVPYEKKLINKRSVKNATTYIYKKADIVAYTQKHNIPLIKNQPQMNVEKMFYSIEEIRDLLERDHGITVNLSTVNRKVTKNNLIPAIRVAAMIRVPILEFEKLEGWKTFHDPLADSYDHEKE